MAKVIADRSEIESISVSPVVGAVEAETARLAKGDLHAGDLTVTVAGYSSDPRELWQIPEVQRWFAEWHQRQPYAPYFLDAQSAVLYVVAQTGAEAVTGKGYRPRRSAESDRLNHEISAGFEALTKQLAKTATKGKEPGDFAAFFAATAPLSAFGLHRKKTVDAIFSSGDSAERPVSPVAPQTTSSSAPSVDRQSARSVPPEHKLPAPKSVSLDTTKRWWQLWK